MTQEQLNQLAKNIIKNNCYLTLGTANVNIPWTSPVFYAVSDKYTLFFYPN
jgi:hypothetical protein